MKTEYTVISTPSADTPGTLLFLSCGEGRYLVGNLSEGASRSIVQENARLRGVSKFILTGKTRWANLGGMMGMILSIYESIPIPKGSWKLDILGGPNLNHILATGRRFINRARGDVRAIEFAADVPPDSSSEVIEPTHTDKYVRIWAMPILPTSPVSGDATEQSVSVNEASSPKAEHSELCKSLVHQMFNNQKTSDTDSTSMILTDVSKLGLGDPYYTPNTQGQLVKAYKTLEEESREVYVRRPWAAAMQAHLPPVVPSSESLCYIICSHPSRGKFMAEKADRLNVPRGPLRGRLTAGETIQTPTGDTITPDMVMDLDRPGTGIAILEIPTIDYIDSLLKRPEWNSEKVMKGVKSFVWILGAGVGKDKRIRQFQEAWHTVNHLVTSPDYSGNPLALEKAATEAMKHNIVDNSTYPQLCYSCGDSDASKTGLHRLKEDAPSNVLLQRAQKLRFVGDEFTVDDAAVSPPWDWKVEQAALVEKLKTLDAYQDLINAAPTQEEKKTWVQEVLCGSKVEVIVLGTASTLPGKSRNVSGTLVRIPGWGSLLLDCGEGTLNTLRRIYGEEELDQVISSIRFIWISHIHADHHLGLWSVIKHWNRLKAESLENAASPHPMPHAKLAVISSVHILRWLHEYASVEKSGLEHVSTIVTHTTFATDYSAPGLGRLSYVYPKSAKSDGATRARDISIEALLELRAFEPVRVRHCQDALALVVTFTSGFKLSYSGDCRPSFDFARVGQGSHICIHEATFEDDMHGEANGKLHSTSGEAIYVAAAMNAKVCLLTHFSQRYPKMATLGPDGSSRLGLVETGEDVVDGDDGGAEDEDATIATHASTEVLPASPTGGLELAVSAYNWESKAVLRLVEDEGGVLRVLEKTGMKVVFAFDYMRFRMKDVPRVEMRQALVRKIYEVEAAEKAAADAENRTKIAEEEAQRIRMKQAAKQLVAEKQRLERRREAEIKAELKKQRKLDEAALRTASGEGRAKRCRDFPVDSTDVPHAKRRTTDEVPTEAPAEVVSKEAVVEDENAETQKRLAGEKQLALANIIMKELEQRKEQERLAAAAGEGLNAEGHADKGDRPTT